MRYVEFTNELGTAVLSMDRIQTLQTQVNDFFSPCQMHFRVETVQTPNPALYGLKYELHSLNDLGPVRSAFQREAQLVVIHTGPWTRPIS